jgi:hypothetical protein
MIKLKCCEDCVYLNLTNKFLSIRRLDLLRNLFQMAFTVVNKLNFPGNQVKIQKNIYILCLHGRMIVQF